MKPYNDKEIRKQIQKAEDSETIEEEIGLAQIVIAKLLYNMLYYPKQ